MTRRTTARRGLTLLEVILSMAIFLMSIVALAELVRIGSDRALDTQQQSRATMLCQAKLDELMIGAEPMSSADFAPFPGKDDSTAERAEKDWDYKVDASQADATGLWNVRVWVKFERADGQVFESVLGRMMLDPAIRGSTLDPPPVDPSSTSPDSSTDPGGSTTNGSGAAAQTPMSGAAAASKTTTSGSTGKTASPGTGKTATPSTGRTTTPAAPAAGKAPAPTTGKSATPAPAGRGGGAGGGKGGGR